MIIHLTGKDSCLDTMIASLSVNVLSSKIILKYLTMNMKFRDKLIFQTMSFTIDIMWCKICLTISVADMLNIIACSKYLESYQKESGMTKDMKKKFVTQSTMCKRNQYISNPLILNVFRYQISEPDRSERKLYWLKNMCQTHIGFPSLMQT